MSPPTRPSISTLILAYNHGPYLRRAVESAAAQVGDFEHEILAIDDGSPDETPEVLARLASEIPLFRYRIKPHAGVGAISRNFNELIEWSSSKYIAFLAADDEFCCRRFDSQLAVLEAEDECAAVYSNGANVEAQVFRDLVVDPRTAQVLSSEAPERILEHLTSSIPALFIQSGLFRRDVVRSFGGFDEELIADDWVFNIRLFDEMVQTGATFHYLSEVVFLRHLLAGRTSANLVVHSRRIEQVIGKYVAESQRSEILRRFYWKSFRKSVRAMRLSDSWRSAKGFAASRLSLPVPTP